MPALPSGYEFHHIGYASTSLENDRTFFSALGYRQEGESFIDPVQGVEGCFLAGHGPRIELLENLPEANTLTPWLKAGIKMYHLAYLVDNLLNALEWARSHRAKVITSPAPAPAFNNQKIGFVIFRNGLVLELIERQKPNSLDCDSTRI